MNPRQIERAAWAMSVALMALAGWSFARGGAARAESPRASASLSPVRSMSTDSVSAWSDAVVSRNPFRFTRVPADVRFGEVVAEPVAEPERPAGPTLRLLGTIGGPPWQGVVTGFPGRERSVVVRPGDEIEGIRVRSVGRDTAVVTGPDSMWTIRVDRRLP